MSAGLLALFDQGPDRCVARDELEKAASQLLLLLSTAALMPRGDGAQADEITLPRTLAEFEPLAGRARSAASAFPIVSAAAAGRRARLEQRSSSRAEGGALRCTARWGRAGPADARRQTTAPRVPVVCAYVHMYAYVRACVVCLQPL